MFYFPMLLFIISFIKKNPNTFTIQRYYKTQKISMITFIYCARYIHKITRREQEEEKLHTYSIIIQMYSTYIFINYLYVKLSSIKLLNIHTYKQKQYTINEY